MYIHVHVHHITVSLSFSLLPLSEMGAGGCRVSPDHGDPVQSGAGETAQQRPSIMHAWRL